MIWFENTDGNNKFPYNFILSIRITIRILKFWLISLSIYEIIMEETDAHIR